MTQIKPFEECFKEKMPSGLPEDQCWDWQYSKDLDGYGRLKYKGKYTKAHRASHELYIGPIPEGLVVRHKCDNRACVNPKHLHVGTAFDNSMDRRDRQRCGVKLTRKIVVMIKLLLKYSLLTQRSIAFLFNVQEEVINKISSNTRWADITID